MFWLVKVLTTGMGETASDFLAHRLGPVPAVGVSGVLLVLALAAQFWSGRYRPAVYWSAVVMVSVFGTVAADVVHVGLGVPYLASTAAFLVALGVIFAAWRRVEGTLSIHSVFTRAVRPSTGRGAGNVRARHGGRRHGGPHARARVVRGGTGVCRDDRCARGAAGPLRGE